MTDEECIGMLVAHGLVGEYLLEYLNGFRVAALEADRPGERCPGCERNRVVIAEDALPVCHDLSAKLLAFGIPALVDYESRKPEAGGESGGMVVAQDTLPVCQDLSAKLLPFGIPAALPDHPGQVVPGDQGRGMVTV